MAVVPNLIAYHALFVREHKRIASAYTINVSMYVLSRRFPYGCGSKFDSISHSIC